MSKILRRPMFRGGPVDSRGTGITSGLGYEAGGRVGYNQGAFVVQPPGAQGKSIFEIQDILKSVGAPMTGQQILDFASANQMNLGRDFKINPKSKFIPDEVVENEGTENEIIIPFSEKIQKEGFQTYEDPNEKYLGSEDTQGNQDEITDLTTEQVTDALKSTDNNDTTGNNTSNTEISAKDLIRENAELFKELLGEGQEEKVKKARIQDASDLGLDVFVQSQKEGATVGSTLGGAAERLIGKESRVEKAIAANEKIDQTGTVLAINDYISGKRSKEQIQQTLAGYAAKAQMAKGTLGQEFAEFRAKQGTLGTTDMQIIIKGRFPGRETEIIPTGAGEYKPNSDGSDEGKFYIEEETKDVYEVVNGKKVKRF